MNAKTGPEFTSEERAAMKQRAKELKANESAAEALADLLARIEQMSDSDRAMAERFHEIVLAAAPDVLPRTWYGMPAYYRNGKLICFFKDAGKFSSRYATIGFEENAALDDGEMWATSFAVTSFTPADQARIAALVAKAMG